MSTDSRYGGAIDSPPSIHSRPYTPTTDQAQLDPLLLACAHARLSEREVIELMFRRDQTRLEQLQRALSTLPAMRVLRQVPGGRAAANLLYCSLCRRDVPPGGHPCITENPNGPAGSEEHLARCRCGTFHEPHCPPWR